MNKLTSYLLFWLVVMLSALMASYLLAGKPFTYAFIDSFISISVLASLSYGIKFQVKFVKFSKKEFYKFIFTYLVTAIILATVWIILARFLIFFLIEENINLLYFKKTIVIRIIIGMLLISVIILYNYLVIFYDSYSEKMIRESELKTQITEAELKTLKFQLNPHFLFNSLNSIASLTLSNSVKANEMTIKLSEYLRSTLSKNVKQKVKIKEELKNARMYLDIEKIRFEDKFIYSEVIEDEIPEYFIPNMLLQPLLENAIKYGVYEAIETININLSITKENEFIKICLVNEYDKLSLSKNKSTGLGIKNVKDRLRLIYGRDDLFSNDITDTLWTVKIFIPIEEG